MTSTKPQLHDLTYSPLLEGRVAVITGASRGIGAETAPVFRAAGASVALASRNEAALMALAEELSNDGTGAIAVPTGGATLTSTACRIGKDDARGSLVSLAELSASVLE